MVICCPRSDLAFSQVREDPNIEFQVINRLAASQNQRLRVLLVASGGCTALSLLSSPAIAQIDAIDANIAQLHLVELRRQAMCQLAIEDQWQLLGINWAPGTERPEPGDRLKRYNQLRSNLPVAVRQYWDQRPAEIAFGVNRVGRFEQLFRQLATQFTAIGVSPLDQPLAAVQHPQWQAVFDRVFERNALANTFGEAAVNYSMDRSFGQHFADVFAQALHQFVPEENYFLTQVWGDRYATGRDGIPVYLQPSAQSTIHALGIDRLKLHHGLFAEKLLELAKFGHFDLIQFSNISDWMPIAELHSMLAIAVQCLTPGGALIGRRLNGDHHLASIMAAHLAVDHDFSQHLQQHDRSFFYREVVVGFCSE